MSRNGIDLSGLVSSIVNLMLSSTELMSFRLSLLWDVFCTTKVLSICLNHRLMGLEAVLSALISKLSMKRLVTMGLISDPITNLSALEIGSRHSLNRTAAGR